MLPTRRRRSCVPRSGAGLTGSLTSWSLSSWTRMSCSAHAEEAADPDYDAVDLPGPVEQIFTDVAELLVRFVVDVRGRSAWQPARCRPAPWAQRSPTTMQQAERTAAPMELRSRRVVLGKRRDEHRRCEQAAESISRIASPLNP